MNLEKVNASLATPCPQCGYPIAPAELRRISATQICDPKYGFTFTASASECANWVHAEIHAPRGLYSTAVLPQNHDLNSREKMISPTCKPK